MTELSAEAAYHAVGLGAGTVGLGSTPAVLVVDLQRLFLEPPLGTAATQDLLERTGHFLAALRRASVAVVYIRTAYDAPDDAGLIWSTKAPAMRRMIRGSREVEIDERVAPAPGDHVVEKRRASGFFETALSSLLDRLGVDSVIIVGSSTSGCVRATAVDAAQLDLRLTVVADCVDDRIAGSHAAALADIGAKYGDVLASADVLDAVSARERQR